MVRAAGRLKMPVDIEEDGLRIRDIRGFVTRFRSEVPR
jgi:hypothetical protein